MDIVAVHWRDRFAVLDDGSTVPITNLFDAYGDEVDDPNDAIAFVAGAGAVWFGYRVDDFEEAELH